MKTTAKSSLSSQSPVFEKRFSNHTTRQGSPGSNKEKGSLFRLFSCPFYKRNTSSPPRGSFLGNSLLPSRSYEQLLLPEINQKQTEEPSESEETPSKKETKLSEEIDRLTQDISSEKTLTQKLVRNRIATFTIEAIFAALVFVFLFTPWSSGLVVGVLALCGFVVLFRRMANVIFDYQRYPTLLHIAKLNAELESLKEARSEKKRLERERQQDALENLFKTYHLQQIEKIQGMREALSERRESIKRKKQEIRDRVWKQQASQGWRLGFLTIAMLSRLADTLIKFVPFGFLASMAFSAFASSLHFANLFLGPTHGLTKIIELHIFSRRDLKALLEIEAEEKKISSLAQQCSKEVLLARISAVLERLTQLADGEESVLQTQQKEALDLEHLRSVLENQRNEIELERGGRLLLKDEHNTSSEKKNPRNGSVFLDTLRYGVFLCLQRFFTVGYAIAFFVLGKGGFFAGEEAGEALLHIDGEKLSVLHRAVSSGLMAPSFLLNKRYQAERKKQASQKTQEQEREEAFFQEWKKHEETLLGIAEKLSITPSYDPA